MRKICFALFVALFVAPITLHADEDDSDAFGVRFSGEADYRIMDGMHVNVSEELRFLGGAGLFDRSYTQVGFSYKFFDFLKAGVSYTAIAVHKSDTTILDTEETTVHLLEWRHRVSGDLSATIKAGQWRFSIRERIQGTYRMCELNNYQQPQMSWVLRSRLKVAYKFRSVPLEPYAYLEPRLCLNGAKWSVESLGDDYKEADFLGHKDVYFNRYRGAIGLEWQLTKRNFLDFYLLYDHLYDKNIDAKKEGSKKGIMLKTPITDYSTNRVSLGVSYKFSF